MDNRTRASLISHLGRDLCGPRTARDARRPGFAVSKAFSMLDVDDTTPLENALLP
jgi:hypothetical protein